jgi:hypothetical protein
VVQDKQRKAVEEPRVVQDKQREHVVVQVGCPFSLLAFLKQRNVSLLFASFHLNFFAVSLRVFRFKSKNNFFSYFASTFFVSNNIFALLLEHFCFKNFFFLY